MSHSLNSLKGDFIEYSRSVDYGSRVLGFRVSRFGGSCFRIQGVGVRMDISIA